MIKSIEGGVLRSAEEAISSLLTRILTVPQVFFEAAWPDSQRHADIVAIDRAGSGDVHVVEIKRRFDQVTAPVIRQVISVPAHFRWIAIPTGRINEHMVQALATKLAKRGIGLISIVVMANGEAGANIQSKPLRAESFDRTVIGDFLKRTVPDIEYGEVPPSSVNGGIAPLSKEKVRKYLDEADHLLDMGHGRAAYLLAWSATEAAMKLVLGASVPAYMPSPGALVREMRDTGNLTALEVDSISEALSIRNTLVHGLNDPQGLSEACQGLTAIARKLLKSAKH